MRRSLLLLAALAAAAALAAGFASSAGAYGGGASHDTWQVGLSFNCTNPASSFCQNPETGLPELGGFWGWVEFDRAADGTITGDAQLTGCGHTTGGGDQVRPVRAMRTSTSRPPIWCRRGRTTRTSGRRGHRSSSLTAPAVPTSSATRASQRRLGTTRSTRHRVSPSTSRLRSGLRDSCVPLALPGLHTAAQTELAFIKQRAPSG